MTPSIVLVPGLCSLGSAVYAPLKAQLQKLGYSEVITINLASVDAIAILSELQPNPLEADIAHVRITVKTLVDAGKDVVVVGHSYGGTPALYATEGLWKHRRAADGLAGGVLRVVLMGSSLSLPGQSVASVRAAWSAESGVQLDGDQSSMHIEMHHDMPIVFPDGFEKHFFADLSETEQAEWAAKGLRNSALGSVTSNAPQGTVSDWRISSLVTTDLDPGMPVDFQQYLINEAREAGAQIEHVRKISSGHFVQITHAKETAEWIREVIS